MASNAIEALRSACAILASGASATDAARTLSHIADDTGSSSIEIKPPDSAFSRVWVRRARGTQDEASVIDFDMAPGHPLSVPMLRAQFGEYVRGVRPNPFADHPITFNLRQPGAPFDITLSARVSYTLPAPTGPVLLEEGTINRVIVMRRPKMLPAVLSDAYQRLVHQVDETDRDTVPEFDTEALLGVTAEERPHVEDLLKARLNARPDPRIPNALVTMKATNTGAWMRRALKRHSDGRLRVAAARALKLLEGSDEAEAVIVEVLQDGTGPERIAAAEAAIHFDGERMCIPVAQLMLDTDPMVRRSGFLAVIALIGLAGYATSRRTILGIMAEGITSPLAAVRQDTLTRFEDIAVHIQNGQRPHEIGLDHLVSEDLERAEQGLDVAVLAQAQGPDREWLERAVLSRLADHRAAITLAGVLKITRAVAPLQELLTGYPDELRAEAARALLTLTDDAAIRQQAEAVLKDA